MKLILILLLFISSASHAALINFNGTFDTDFDGSVGTPQGITNLNGNWSFQFDDSIVVGDPGDETYSTSLTGLTLSPNPLGATVFDLSNTGADLIYRDGALLQIFVYGDPNGSGFAILAAFDDFAVSYLSTGNIFSAAVSTAAVLGSNERSTILSGTYTSSPVPLPAAFWLFGSALIGLNLLAKHRNKSIN